MNTHTHTPGPWRKSKISPHIYGPENEYLAICENPLNALLVAAAPDMLEALKDAEFLLRKAGIMAGPMKDSFNRSASDARAAIAKAEGRDA
jgi:hypothetical protein